MYTKGDTKETGSMSQGSNHNGASELRQGYLFRTSQLNWTLCISIPKSGPHGQAQIEIF